MKVYCTALISLIISLELIVGRYIDDRKERRTKGIYICLLLLSITFKLSPKSSYGGILVSILKAIIK